MKIAVYPGSFNPWHEGHDEVLQQAMDLFDKVIIAVGQNPDKPFTAKNVKAIRDRAMDTIDPEEVGRKVSVTFFDGLLVDFIGRLKEEGTEVSVIVRGLRNSTDFEAEKIQQYWNEDLGIRVPTLYLIANRHLAHISSSAVRAVVKAKRSKK